MCCQEITEYTSTHNCTGVPYCPLSILVKPVYWYKPPKLAAVPMFGHMKIQHTLGHSSSVECGCTSGRGIENGHILYAIRLLKKGVYCCRKKRSEEEEEGSVMPACLHGCSFHLTLLIVWQWTATDKTEIDSIKCLYQTKT